MNKLTLKQPLATPDAERQAAARFSAGAVLAARRQARAIKARPGFDFDDELAAAGLLSIDTDLRQAAATLRRLPGSVWPSGYRSFWPDIVRDKAEAYGMQPAKKPRLQPTADDISRMDRIHIALMRMDKDMAKVIWARSIGISFAQIAKDVGVSKWSIRRDYLAALILLKAALAR